MTIRRLFGFTREQQIAAYKSSDFWADTDSVQAVKLVGWWPVGLHAGLKDFDYSNHRNHGTRVGGPSPTATRHLRLGPIRAESFDGVDDTVEIPSSAHLSFGPGVSKTLTAWHFDPTGPIPGQTSLVAKDGSTKREWGLSFANRQFGFLTFDAAGTPTTFTQSSPIQYTAGRWNFVAVGYDASLSKMFLQWNDHPREFSGSINDVVAGAQGVTIGGSEFNKDQPQTLADIRIYDLAQSESVTKEIYEKPWRLIHPRGVRTISYAAPATPGGGYTSCNRASMVNISSPWRGILPPPNGVMTLGDRQQLAFMYCGISALAGIAGPASWAEGQVFHPRFQLGETYLPGIFEGDVYHPSSASAQRNLN